MNTLIFLIATILCSCAYRLGGSAKNDSWYDILKHSKTRDWGCTIIALITLALMGKTIAWYWYIPTFIACWAAFTTYFDDIGVSEIKLLRKGEDKYWLHLMVIGAMFILFPITSMVSWLGYVLRIIAMGGFGLLSHYINRLDIPHKDVVSELVRGGSVIMTLPLLMI